MRRGAGAVLAAQPVTDPKKKDAAKTRERLRGLLPQQAAQLRRAMELHTGGERLLSGQLLLDLARTAADHPEVLRWRAMRHAADGEWPAAAACLQRAAAARPDDFGILLQLGAAQNDAGAFAAAVQALRAARPCTTDAQELFDLCVEFDRQGHLDDALSAIHAAMAAGLQAPVAKLQRARCLKALGHAQAAADDYRSLIAANQLPARAWFGLLDLKTVRLAPGEMDLLQRAAGSAANAPGDQVLLDFAFGKALEDAGAVEQAFAVLNRANRGARPSHPWNAELFSRRVSAVQTAFAAAAAARAPTIQGQEVIFLVGLPRSGTTLVEQLLASHSRVEGASELPYLNAVIEEESRRRFRPFPDWVSSTSAAGWARLGQRYLTLSARWRAQRPVATDKLPDNWLLAGAAMAMLPGARVIDCRREPLETCWSCYKQLFGPDQVNFSYDFETLAAYWHDYDRLCRYWAQQVPQQFHVQHYEDLIATPEQQIRALLNFCGLPFEPGCLEFHKAQRAIRTPSALQVRQPMRQTSTPAAGYGALLDPLRHLLHAHASAKPAE